MKWGGGGFVKITYNFYLFMLVLISLCLVILNERYLSRLFSGSNNGLSRNTAIHSDVEPNILLRNHYSLHECHIFVAIILYQNLISLLISYNFHLPTKYIYIQCHNSVWYIVSTSFSLMDFNSTDDVNSATQNINIIQLQYGSTFLDLFYLFMFTYLLSRCTYIE